MNEKIPVRLFWKRRLNALKRRLKRTGNSAGFATIYADVARDVVSAYPEISVVEKQMVFAGFKHDAELSEVFTGRDDWAGLAEASKILGISVQ